MSLGTVIGIIFLIIVTIALHLLFSGADKTRKDRKPTHISHLHDTLELIGHSMWLVTITRRSGYNYSAWNVPGSRENAVDFAIEKLRHARVDTVEVMCNRANKFEVRVFYDSTGTRRTGKYIGGFVITPQK